MSNFNLLTDARLANGSFSSNHKTNTAVRRSAVSNWIIPKAFVILCSRWMIVLVSLALSACASLRPAIEEINEHPGRQLVLIVEEAQHYNTPIHMQAGGTGFALLDIVGGLTALSIESRYEELHKQLNAQAKNAQLHGAQASPHAQFLKLFESRLQAMGLRVEVRSSPFKITGIGASGREYMYPSPSAPVKPQELAYGLRLDMGNCSLSRTMPCIRYSWTKLTKADATARVQVYLRHLKTIPVIPRSQALQEALPGYRAELPKTDDDIRAFDRALHQLVDQAVEQLMKDIQGEKS